jgi:GT2 family glycosyltransferase
MPSFRQDFDRGIPCWSRKVWKAVGGLGEEASSATGLPGEDVDLRWQAFLRGFDLEPPSK